MGFAARPVGIAMTLLVKPRHRAARRNARAELIDAGPAAAAVGRRNRTQSRSEPMILWTGPLSSPPLHRPETGADRSAWRARLRPASRRFEVSLSRPDQRPGFARICGPVSVGRSASAAHRRRQLNAPQIALVSASRGPAVSRCVRLARCPTAVPDCERKVLVLGDGVDPVKIAEIAAGTGRPPPIIDDGKRRDARGKKQLFASRNAMGSPRPVACGSS